MKARLVSPFADPENIVLTDEARRQLLAKAKSFDVSSLSDAIFCLIWSFGGALHNVNSGEISETYPRAVFGAYESHQVPAAKIVEIEGKKFVFALVRDEKEVGVFIEVSLVNGEFSLVYGPEI